MYFPPQPPTYRVEASNANGTRENTFTYALHLPRPVVVRPPVVHAETIKTSNGEDIVTLWIPRRGNTPQSRRADDTTLLFSHGNATDLGICFPVLDRLAVALGVNIFAYDYSGYGGSTGKPSPKNTNADIEAAYEYLRSKYPQQSQKVILYGQSLGTALSVYLGSKLCLKGDTAVAGAILHSPLMSALRCLRDIEQTKWYDVYPSIDDIKNITFPIFLIHGKEDADIPIHHTFGLLANAQVPYEPWYAESCGHNDIEAVHPVLYRQKLQAFIDDVRDGKANRFADSIRARLHATLPSHSLSPVVPSSDEAPSSAGVMSSR